MKPYLKLFLIIFGSLLAAYLVLKFIAPLIVPFILAFLLSLAMEPLVRLLEGKLKMSRGPSVLISLAVFLVAIFALVGFLVRRLIIELINLSVALPGISKQLWPMIQQWQKSSYSYFLKLPEPITSNYPKVTEAIQSNINSLLSRLQDITSSLLNTLLSTITGVTGIFIIIVFAVIATYFFSRDRGLIMRFWINILPEPWGKKSIQVIKDILQALAGYVKAQALLITMTMILTTIGLYIIGAKYALTMGIIIGLCDLLPVLGPGTIYIPWAIFSIAQGDTAFGIALAVLYVVVLVIRQIMETKLVSENMGLHPLATLIAIYVGLQLFGVLGVVIGPVLLISIKAIAKAANITIIK